MQPPRAKTPFHTPLDAAGNRLGQLIERALQLAALDRRLRQSLPPALAAECRLANAEEDRLVFLVSSPVWKTRLRMASADVLAAAATAGFPANKLILKVATMQPVPRGPTPHKPLSAAARQHLDAAALSIGDPELRDQLLRLASLSE